MDCCIMLQQNHARLLVSWEEVKAAVTDDHPCSPSGRWQDHLFPALPLVVATVGSHYTEQHLSRHVPVALPLILPPPHLRSMSIMVE